MKAKLIELKIKLDEFVSEKELVKAEEFRKRFVHLKRPSYFTNRGSYQPTS
jgi:arginyl-tRNA synthetase